MARRRSVLYVAEPQSLRNRLIGLARWEGARFRSVGAYFRLSLGTVFDVHGVAPADFFANPGRAASYDIVVVMSTDIRRKKRHYAERLAAITGLPMLKVLFDAGDIPGEIPPDKTLDVFDVFFKREPFRDRDRYPISARNKAKMRATMLPCLSVRPSRFRNLATIDTAAYGNRLPNPAPATDVFFLGGATSPRRLEIVRTLRAQPFDFSGGLHPGLRGLEVEPAISSPRLFQGGFSAKARNARINLALEGRGPFTFRHLDFWCLCCFMLSPPEIAELETPLPYVDGRHYVSFNSLDDLVDKCRYYLVHDTERTAIAAAGRQLFEEHYSFDRHGAAIAAAIDGQG